MIATMKPGEIVTYYAPGFRPRQFRVETVGPSTLTTQEYRMVPLDGQVVWEREDAWQALSRVIGERFLVESRAMRAALVRTREG